MKRKKKRWPVVVAVLAVCAVAAVFVAPRLPGGLPIPGFGTEAASVSAVSAEAALGDVVSSVVATGNLAGSTVDAEAPLGVEIEDILVADGDDVAEGDAVATVASDSLSSRISDVRDELDDVNDAIGEIVDGDTETVYVRSKATARVKGIYIKEGDRVEDVVATDGALALLSLDGLMAVDIASETELKRGYDVTVVLSDGTEKDGAVERASDGNYTVTLTDNGPALGDRVTVKYGDQAVGEGVLEVHEPLKVTYGGGEAISVYVDENDRVYNGTSLLKIEKSAADTGFASLTAKRDALVALLERLSALTVDRTLYAPVSGTVDSVAATEGAALTTSDSALTASEGAILTIADAANMALSVEIDELDVAAISPGLETEVEIDAIEGETFKGSVASVSEDATVENGVAKYTATIEIERSDAMKAGLSATATITKEKREGVVTIPLAAVQEFGDRVFVYTSLDGDTGAPAGEQEIETGLSDGTNVEVVSGLNEGDTVYYTPAASDEEAQAQMMFPGMMGGDTRGMADRGTPPAGGGTRPSGSDSSGGAPAAPGGN